MQLELFVSIVTPQITLLIKALFHVMKQVSQRPRKRVPNLLDPQSLILIWDTGASYELPPFFSDFINYMECDIPGRDVTKGNNVIGIGTTLHKFTDTDVNQSSSYVYPITYQRQMFVYSPLKHTTKCMVGIPRFTDKAFK